MHFVKYLLTIRFMHSLLEGEEGKGLSPELKMAEPSDRVGEVTEADIADSH